MIYEYSIMCILIHIVMFCVLVSHILLYLVHIINAARLSSAIMVWNTSHARHYSSTEAERALLSVW